MSPWTSCHEICPAVSLAHSDCAGNGKDPGLPQFAQSHQLTLWETILDIVFCLSHGHSGKSNKHIVRKVAAQEVIRLQRTCLHKPKPSFPPQFMSDLRRRKPATAAYSMSSGAQHSWVVRAEAFSRHRFWRSHSYFQLLIRLLHCRRMQTTRSCGKVCWLQRTATKTDQWFWLAPPPRPASQCLPSTSFHTQASLWTPSFSTSCDASRPS
jgi:hypothetical protein